MSAQENLPDAELLRLWRSVSGPGAGLTGPLIRYAGLVWARSRNYVAHERLKAEKEADERLRRQFVEVSEMLSAAGVGACSIVEGVRRVIGQRDNLVRLARSHTFTLRELEAVAGGIVLDALPSTED